MLLREPLQKADLASDSFLVSLNLPMRYRIEFKFRDGSRTGTLAMPIIVESDDVDGVLALALKKERVSAATQDPLIAIGISVERITIIDEKSSEPS